MLASMRGGVLSFCHLGRGRSDWSRIILVVFDRSPANAYVDQLFVR